MTHRVSPAVKDSTYRPAREKGTCPASRQSTGGYRPAQTAQHSFCRLDRGTGTPATLLNQRTGQLTDTRLNRHCPAERSRRTSDPTTRAHCGPPRNSGPARTADRRSRRESAGRPARRPPRAARTVAVCGCRMAIKMQKISRLR